MAHHLHEHQGPGHSVGPQHNGGTTKKKKWRKCKN